MKVILFRRPDGGCSVVRPAPEMFNPNSRTIRQIENEGFVFPAVVKVLEIEQAKLETLKGKIKDASEEMVSMIRLASNEAAEPEDKTGALSKIETLKGNIREQESGIAESVTAALGDRTKHPDFDLESFIESAWVFIVAKAVPLGAEWKYAEDSEFPDREYRNAWHADDYGNIVIDMDKARDIHRKHMRECRCPLLSALDIEYQRADESDNRELKASIAAQKQALRDVTKLAAIDEAQTPEDLKKAWPEYLGVRNVL